MKFGNITIGKQLFVGWGLPKALGLGEKQIRGAGYVEGPLQVGKDTDYSEVEATLMIGAEFIGMIMLIVYVGAVAVLFLFVVMMLNVSQQKNTWLSGEKNSNHIPIGLLISTIIFFELIIVAGGWKYKPELLKSFSSIGVDIDSTNTHEIGKVLYTDYIHLFQLSGMILLVAMIGAIVLTFRQRSNVKRQSYIKQISRERAEGVSVVEVASNKGVKIDD